MQRIIVLGESRLDVIVRPDGSTVARPGALMLDIACRLADNGESPIFLTELATDSVGDLIATRLADKGVDITYIDRFTDGRTPLVVNTGQGNPTLYTDYPATDGLDITWPRIDEGDIIVCGDYMTTSPRWQHNMGQFLDNCRRRKAVILYIPGDIAWREPRATKVMPAVFDLLEIADAVVLTPAMACYYFGSSSIAEAYDNTVRFHCPAAIGIAPDGTLATSGTIPAIPDTILALIAETMKAPQSRV